ncbi:MAG: single-stranded DNA-binding protein [Carnobacterium sp.]|jgi:single-strand DNA-binding protein|uniref:Single-stranded DNA-binding protein n=2 Tax=Carnobacterium maltaromaticum TaxID=2751 RepID=K8E172_CARML|nr:MULTISPECIES: single-stranded DNA-binding protein [Carnobacterium]AOA03497.1 single-stranded DNA-binding protein [Carnobacterium maltaromaticum]KRN61171.1 single-strand DNA-binding protein [Carnobacterium maltaromaticum DSM 20342]KRN73019.1 single-strand DNA-binding protein [Carnobacterium maltaromaticum]KRN86343.1 single-strand DNA-binding protein [Carnobacterium maltaromaticum]MBC9787787.1 single-stranded DNA-binding protein [Carnobacterium maltaromaticum]
MINRVVLVGRLTKDADLRYTSSGTAVASFTVAVNRQFTNQSGEREADFINCVAWRKTAETLANFTRKGSLVGVEGRIQTRSYDNQQGQRVYVTEVVVDTFSMLESKSTNEQRQSHDTSGSNGGATSPSKPSQQSGGYQQNSYNSNANNQSSAPQQQYQNSNRNEDPFASSGQPIDISDDDLPF